MTDPGPLPAACRAAFCLVQFPAHVKQRHIFRAMDAMLAAERAPSQPALLPLSSSVLAVSCWPLAFRRRSTSPFASRRLMNDFSASSRPCSGARRRSCRSSEGILPDDISTTHRATLPRGGRLGTSAKVILPLPRPACQHCVKRSRNAGRRGTAEPLHACAAHKHCDLNPRERHHDRARELDGN